MADWFGKETPKLGFGLMRLPRKGVIDVEQTKKMVDLFMDAGFTYFDTAHVYPGSEKAIAKALVSRYPRENYTLATKLCAWQFAPTEKEAKQQFYTSLERTGAEYFDYYLLHALMANNYTSYDKYNIWDFVQEQKAKGLIRHAGFSYHADPDLLNDILTKHPEVEFVQLQINYADWEDRKVASHANYDVVRAHGKSVVIMEPVKGGKLANPPKEIKKMFQEAHPDMSPASWAIRFAASLDGVITVLSGMSNVAQMRDNLSYMKDFTPLDDEEQKIIQEAQRILGKTSTIPCTGCHYCTAGCPQQIPIPEIFAARNKDLGNGQEDQAKAAYEEATRKGGKASSCIGCLQCENACPQQLPVTEYLKQCADAYEK
ncbi:MAG: aldo/keto reductase [Clostridia bacterium]|nr:aldo/keto reductase [Clostridia bacterium]